MRRWAIASVVGFLLLSLSIDAQVVTGNLIGIIRDESRSVLPGASVTITSRALPGGPSTAVTNVQGEYRFTGLPPGIYQLTVTLTGFKTYIEQDLQVTVNGTVERNIGLPVASVEETITVSGQSPVVDTRQVGVAKSLSADVVESIPHSRMGSPAAFMATLPGVTATNYNRIGGASVMGSADRETSYMSDGILSNGVTGGAAYNYLDFDAIEDLNVVTLGASSEYQQAQGGVMNMVTKAGTNTFRADGMHYWAPDSLASSPIKLPCNCPLGDTGFKQYKYVDFGYHAGGPIWKDHIWYFGGVSNAGPSYRNPGQPDQPEEFQWVRDEYRSNHKFTWKASSKINVSQVLYYEWWHWSNPDFPTFTRPLETVSWYTGDIKSGASEVTAVLTPTTFLTARYTVNDTPYGDIPFGPNLAHDSTSLVTASHDDQFTGVRSVSDIFADAIQSRRDDVSVKLNRYISGARLSHNIRFGVQAARNRSFTQTVTPGGVVYQDQNGAPFQASFTPVSTDASRYMAYGVWAENEMNVGGRLTITPGVRIDRMKASSPDAPMIDPTVSIGNGGLCKCVQSFPFTGESVPGLGELQTWTTVAPRVGVNYKLTEDGKTVLRGTIGRYYRRSSCPSSPGCIPESRTRRSVSQRRDRDVLQPHFRHRSEHQPGRRSGHGPALHRSVLDRRGSRAGGECGRERHLRPQAFGGPDRVAGRGRRLRDADRDRAQRAAGHRLSAAQQRDRASVRAHQRRRLLQPLQRHHVRRVAPAREPLDGKRELHVFSR